MDNSLKRMSRASPLRGCDALSVAERSTLDHASAMSPFYLGRRLILFVGHKKYPGVALRPGPHTCFARHHAYAAAPAGELFRSAAWRNALHCQRNVRLTCHPDSTVRQRRFEHAIRDSARRLLLPNSRRYGTT